MEVENFEQDICHHLLSCKKQSQIYNGSTTQVIRSFGLHGGSEDAREYHVFSGLIMRKKRPHVNKHMAWLAKVHTRIIPHCLPDGWIGLLYVFTCMSSIYKSSCSMASSSYALACFTCADILGKKALHRNHHA